MKRCAFLTMDHMGSYVNDDALAIDALRTQHWDVQSIPWRTTNAEWGAFDIVVIRSPWDYSEAPEAFLKSLEAIDATATHLQNSLDIVRWNIDKRYLLDLEKRGVNIVPTLFGKGSGNMILSDIGRSIDSDTFVIKPVISASAKDTFLVNKETDSDPSIMQVFRNKQFMVQPFMHHIVEEGEFSLFFFNGDYSHCIRKVPKSNDFRVQEEHGGHIEAFSPDIHLLDCAQNVLENLDQSVLYARVDLVRDEKGDYALMELELIEPSLYLRMDSEAPLRFAKALDAIL